MIKIKRFKEEWVDGLKYKPITNDDTLYFEVFKNPTKAELKLANEYGLIRGIVLKDGDFYIVAPSSKIIHADLVMILSDLKIITEKYIWKWWTSFTESLEEFLCVAGRPFEFTIAESYFASEDNILTDEVFNEYKTNFENKNSNYTLGI